jgi:hypothetical protein
VLDISIAEPWLLILYPVFFVVIWVGISAATAMAAGWPTLAQRFRTAERPAGEMFPFASGLMRTRFLPIRYGRSLNVTVGDAGVRLAILFPFRALHAPLLLPWSAIESVTREAGAFGRQAVVIDIRHFNRRLVLFGKAGERVAAKFDRLKVHESLDSARRSQSLGLSEVRPLG